MSNAQPEHRAVDRFLRSPHQPHQYLRYAAVRLDDSAAFDEAFDALVAMPRLPDALQAEREQALRVLRLAVEQGDPELARTAQWNTDVPSIAYVLDMGASDSGGTVWLHNAWNEMVNQFARALVRRR